jgi:hypothetical protein
MDNALLAAGLDPLICYSFDEATHSLIPLIEPSPAAKEQLPA